MVGGLAERGEQEQAPPRGGADQRRAGQRPGGHGLAREQPEGGADGGVGEHEKRPDEPRVATVGQQGAPDQAEADRNGELGRDQVGAGEHHDDAPGEQGGPAGEQGAGEAHGAEPAGRERADG
ncbi:MAG: hypothetical protein JHD04_06300, partial [Nocardioides sp.]|nr:hypothetical protein [Nocardioides sp.]